MQGAKDEELNHNWSKDENQETVGQKTSSKHQKPQGAKHEGLKIKRQSAKNRLRLRRYVTGQKMKVKGKVTVCRKISLINLKSELVT